MLLPELRPEAGPAVTARTEATTAALSPECQLGECALCPGDGIPVHAPGKRTPGEPPAFVIRCGHACRHGRSGAGVALGHDEAPHPNEVRGFVKRPGAQAPGSAL